MMTDINSNEGPLSTLSAPGRRWYSTDSMRWLTLLTTLPPTPTRHRVGVWRKLQRMGAVRLRGSAWILPETAETTERFQWLVQEIQAFRGEATLLHVDRVGTMDVPDESEYDRPDAGAAPHGSPRL